MKFRRRFANNIESIIETDSVIDSNVMDPAMAALEAEINYRVEGQKAWATTKDSRSKMPTQRTASLASILWGDPMNPDKAAVTTTVTKRASSVVSALLGYDKPATRRTSVSVVPDYGLVSMMFGDSKPEASETGIEVPPSTGGKDPLVGQRLSVNVGVDPRPRQKSLTSRKSLL